MAHFIDEVEHSIDAGAAMLPPLSPLHRYTAALGPKPTSAQALRIAEIEPAVAAALIWLSAARKGPAAPSTKTFAARNLPAAVAKLGPAEVAKLAHLIAARDTSFMGAEAASGHLRRMWTNTLYTAVASRELARRLSYPAPEDAYLAGLLHNAGEPLLVRMLAERVPRSGQHLYCSDIVVNVIGSNHGRVGHRLLAKWGLPREIVMVARDHHSEIRSELQALVEVAYESALDYGYVYLAARHSQKNMHRALAYLGLNARDLDGLPAKIGPSLNDALSVTGKV